jgi:hypothetical protein
VYGNANAQRQVVRQFPPHFTFRCTLRVLQFPAVLSV